MVDWPESDETYTLEIEVDRLLLHNLIQSIDAREGAAVEAAKRTGKEEHEVAAIAMGELEKRVIEALPAELLPDDVVDDDGNLDWDLVSEFGEMTDIEVE